MGYRRRAKVIKHLMDECREHLVSSRHSLEDRKHPESLRDTYLGAFCAAKAFLAHERFEVEDELVLDGIETLALKGYLPYASGFYLRQMLSNSDKAAGSGAEQEWEDEAFSLLHMAEAFVQEVRDRIA